MYKINEILPLEHVFTSPLDTIAPKLKKLYYRGKLPSEGAKTVAVVGSRKLSKYGEEYAYKFGYDLVQRGLVVVSGLALGVDALAHKGALDAGGITVAVLGSGVDDITPRTNRALGERILDSGGAIISEYAPGTPAYATQFVERNRIVSGLSDAVIIIEAAVRSGSLTTAAYALEQGKAVFALPGNIGSPMSAGSNRLIKQGAYCLTEVKDVLEVIAPEKLEQGELSVFGDNELENQILKLIQEGVRDGEFLVARLGISAGEFNQTVTMMELKGSLRALGANRWTLG